MPVFVERLGQWARPPSGVASGHVGGVATVLEQRYLVLAGGRAPSQDTTGNAGAADSYDELGLVSDDSIGLILTPLTMVTVNDTVLLINATGAAWLDFTTTLTATPPMPAGLASWGDVAGGRVLIDTLGNQFVVGGTRSGAATSAVLEVDTEGSLTAYSLTTPRSGAAATWAEGAGLLWWRVAAASAAASRCLRRRTVRLSPKISADATTGAGATVVAASSSQVLLAGGTLDGGAAPTRTFDAGARMDARLLRTTAWPCRPC